MDNKKEAIVNLKSEIDDFSVEFEVIPLDDENSLRKEISRNLDSIEKQLTENQKKIGILNEELDKLTCHADGIDYMVAVVSGTLAAMVDSIWTGEFSIDRANEWGNEKVNDFVKRIGNNEDLNVAISNLEEKTKKAFASDPNLNDFGGGRQHHLRDFAHHPTPTGLMFSMLTQFSGCCYGTDTNGLFIVVPVKDVNRIGKTLPEKIVYGTVYWFLHLVSDMAGTSKTAGNGTGLPGPLLSFAKEVSVLPFFRDIRIDDMQLSVWISKLFNGTLLAKRDENGKIIEAVKFDLRTEVGIGHELGRQAVPVLLNECIVRAFYFIRRLYLEVKETGIKSLNEIDVIDWKKVLPFKNRTITRMLTIATGTFTALDLADAAVHAAAKSGVGNPMFLTNFALRVNFVGVGRCVVAVGIDVGMEFKKNRTRNERMLIYNQQMHLMNAKVFYKQADMWLEAKEASIVIDEAYNMIASTHQYFIEARDEIEENLNKIDECLPEVEQKNKGILDEINDILIWG